MIKEVKGEKPEVVAAKSAVAKDAPKKQIDISPSAKKSKMTKEAFKALIEDYKKKNPVKYEMKKESLQKQLEALG